MVISLPSENLSLPLKEGLSRDEIQQIIICIKETLQIKEGCIKVFPPLEMISYKENDILK